MCCAYVWPRAVQCQGHSSRFTMYDCITCPLYNSWRVGDNLKWLCTITKYHETMCRTQHCLTILCVRSISFEALVWFTNHSAQMPSMMSRCAVGLFDQTWVKVTVKHCMTITVLLARFITLKGLMTFWNNVAHLYSTNSWCAERMFDQGHFKINVTFSGQTHCCVLSISFEPLKGLTNNYAQMSRTMCRYAVRMFDQGRL